MVFMYSAQVLISRSVPQTVLLGKYRQSDKVPYTEQVLAHNPQMPNTIGGKIKARRDELGLKASAVAKRAGLSKQAYSSLENGHQKTSTKLHTICQFLGLSPNWVEFGRGPRLLGGQPSSTADQTSVQSPAEQSTQTEVDETMGGMARDVLEDAMLLASMPLDQRRAISAVIRQLAPHKLEIKTAEKPILTLTTNNNSKPSQK
jgi:transcriptional regulator with XRE-family HTH domain